VGLIYGYVHERGISLPKFSSWTQSDNSILQRAYDNRQSNLQVQGEDVVQKILSDDLEGSRHQRFILRLSSGQTLLVAHNVDLAPRICSLRRGDKVKFYGEYEWNEKGGAIHWTQHDSSGRHIGGWLKHDGKTYQ
jgi:hypothetical protein